MLMLHSLFICQVALEELHDLKEVWSELSKVWEQIDQMKEQPWVSVQPRKVLDFTSYFNIFKCLFFFFFNDADLC